MLKNLYNKFVLPDDETPKVLAFVKKFSPQGERILDVGCGYGRYLKPLSEMGYKVVGVEQNQDIVRKNQQAGLACISVDAFQADPAEYHCIIMSHIIEHFTPTDLLAFMNFYLSKLKKGGYLIIATPLYSDYFYDDFDHVKPYQPLGLQMVFGGNEAQVQYYSAHQLQLRDLWFRKAPRLSRFHRAKYIKSLKTKWLQLYDLAMAILFKISLKAIARKDGWVGVYQKVNNV